MTMEREAHRPRREVPSLEDFRARVPQGGVPFVDLCLLMILHAEGGDRAPVVLDLCELARKYPSLVTSLSRDRLVSAADRGLLQRATASNGEAWGLTAQGRIIFERESAPFVRFGAAVREMVELTMEDWSSRIASAVAPIVQEISRRAVAALEDGFQERYGYELSALFSWSEVLPHERPSMLKRWEDLGIPLAGAVPPKVMLRLGACEESTPQMPLFRLEGPILNQCSASLEVARQAGVEPAEVALAAIREYRCRHVMAAQAIASCAYDPALYYVREMWEKVFADVGTIRERTKGMTSQKQREVLRDRLAAGGLESPVAALPYALVLGSARAAEAQFHLSNGAPVPQAFSRHATAHSGLVSHFNRANALRAIMAVSALCWALAPSAALDEK